MSQTDHWVAAGHCITDENFTSESDHGNNLRFKENYSCGYSIKFHSFVTGLNLKFINR